MKPKVLNDEESSLVFESGDEVFLEIINGMNLLELRSFDIYSPNDLMHYNSIQCSWLHAEKHLLSNRGDAFHEVSE